MPKIFDDQVREIAGDLAQHAVTLPRAASILARLAQVEINDNWVNKPMHSLESIFRAWMPQTAANHQQRVDLMKKLAEKFPDVAWKNLCRPVRR